MNLLKKIISGRYQSKSRFRDEKDNPIHLRDYIYFFLALVGYIKKLLKIPSQLPWINYTAIKIIKIIIINIGGGIQEILGFYLKNNLKYKPMIICTGAAIAYLTKDQAPINNFIDKIYLGWLLRIIFHPSAFFPRYIYAFKLFFLVLKNKITISSN